MKNNYFDVRTSYTDTKYPILYYIARSNENKLNFYLERVTIVKTLLFVILKMFSIYSIKLK